MKEQAKQEDLQFKIEHIRNNIIRAMNDGYAEAINDMDYYDKPLLELINTEVLSALGELEEEYEKDVNSEWFSSSGGQVDLVSFAQSIKNRYK